MISPSQTRKPNRIDELVKLGRFVAVGVLNTIVGYAVFMVIWQVSQNYVIAVVLGTIINVTFNYFSTGRLVFANRGLKTMLPYFGGYALIMLLNLALIELLTRAGLSVPIAGFVGLPVVVLASYGFNRLVVFRKPTK